jgi:hypothetical protein
MDELAENKRYAIAATLIFRQRAIGFDDGGQMLIRQMRKIEHSADEALKAARAESAERATELTMTLREIGGTEHSFPISVCHKVIRSYFILHVFRGAACQRRQDRDRVALVQFPRAGCPA